MGAPEFSRPGDATIAIVSCGKAKIWDRSPHLSQVPASFAYTSSLFKLSRNYAELRCPKAWVILSAKYGFLKPTDLISQYNCAFGKDDDTISIESLQNQWQTSYLFAKTVVSLCSKAYDSVLRRAIPQDVKIIAPLRGLNLFQRTEWLGKTTT
jgi:cytoplasmic iron level regulating protein YaaA (DUF328/UPF0246 family)